jgi:AraC-like DNA-binding protein
MPDAIPDIVPASIAGSLKRGSYVFIDLSARASGPVACAGLEECMPDYSVERRGFRFPAMEYIAGGEWELNNGKKTWRLQPGAIFTYGPGISYSLRPISRTGLLKYFVDFTGPKAWSELRCIGPKPGTPASLKNRRWLQDLLDQLIDTESLPQKQRAGIAAKLGRLILDRIPMDSCPPILQTRSRSSYERCREYLALHYTEIRDLADAARQCGISAVHLCRLFQRYAQETPHAYLTRLKINHAADCIARKNLLVKEAAAEVGFEDPYHFSRVFKKVLGIPPSRFGFGKKP